MKRVYTVIAAGADNLNPVAKTRHPNWKEKKNVGNDVDIRRKIRGVIGRVQYRLSF
jgi:hypothetical protein